MKDITDVRIASFNETNEEGKHQEEPPKNDNQTPNGLRKKKTSKKRDAQIKSDKGISPRSPTIYLLQEEKTYLDRLKAYITLSTGEKPYDHMLVMAALKEYVRKNYKEFNENYQV